MTLQTVTMLCGGLAFFLFGMHIMSSSLEKVAGGRMEHFLEKMTASPVIGLLLGAFITVMIQSSSALTVMLVGFVNSGLMEISQTAAIIMGSNIGTTLTAWILSLSGIESDNLFLMLLKPESFSPIVALIGIVLMMVSKKQRYRDLGMIMAGFSVLMYGMQLMSDAVAPLADSPSFVSLLTAFDVPVFGILAGTIFTGVIQSSAASVGVLQALAMTGSVTYGMALPIIMGQNIGTCVTALLSSVGVNRNARKVSIIHISFNLIGTIAGMTLYELFRYMVCLPVFQSAISPVAIALFHTAFNLLATLLLFPFREKLVAFADRLIPNQTVEEEVIIDERLLITPGIAIQTTHGKVMDMIHQSVHALQAALSMLFLYEEETAADIRKAEEQMDTMEDVLTAYLARISSCDVTEADNARIVHLLKSIPDIERISDHAMELSLVAKGISKRQTEFSIVSQKEIQVLGRALSDILCSLTDTFEHNVFINCVMALADIEAFNDLLQDVRVRHTERIRSGICDAENGTSMNDILLGLERVAAHSSNIILYTSEAGSHRTSGHSFFTNLKDKEQLAFTNRKTEFYTRFSVF